MYQIGLPLIISITTTSLKPPPPLTWIIENTSYQVLYFGSHSTVHSQHKARVSFYLFFFFRVSF